VRDFETGVGEQASHALHALALATRRLTDDQPLTHLVLHESGLCGRCAGMDDAADHLLRRNRRSNHAAGIDTL
jgi:hypothetical protein